VCCLPPVTAAAARLSTSVAKPAVQVVTHLCYSDFQDIMEAVDAMDGER
jgi:5-methyltetrahydropteroyltriglutamate--homocysteine methyltransferase